MTIDLKEPANDHYIEMDQAEYDTLRFEYERSQVFGDDYVTFETYLRQRINNGGVK